MKKRIISLIAGLLLIPVLAFAGPWISGGSGGSGNVTGPASSTAHNIAKYADTTGKVLEDGGALIPSGSVTNQYLCRYLSAAGGSIPCDVNPASLVTGLVEKLVVFHWGDGVTAVTAAASTKVCADAPYTATLTGVKLTAEVSPTSDVTIALFKDAQASGATANATTAMISGTNAVTLAGAGAGLTVIDVTLTNYTKTVTAGDQICATITATDTAKWLHLTLYGTR